MTGERTTILDIRDLQITLPPGGDRPYALSDFNLTVGEGEIVCLVGESGSGKSLAANAVMRLLPEPHVRVSQGTISLGGQDLLSLSEAEMRAIRGDRMAMIFQEPMTALNPQKTVGWQIDEVLKLHTRLSRAERKARALEILGAADAAGGDVCEVRIIPLEYVGTISHDIRDADVGDAACTKEEQRDESDDDELRRSESSKHAYFVSVPRASGKAVTSAPKSAPRITQNTGGR